MDANNNYSFNATEKLLSSLKDQSVYITLTKKGEVLAVNGYNEIASHAISQVQITDDNQRKALQNQLADLLGENFIKGNVTQGENLLSVHTLREGDSWTKNTSETIPFPVKATTHYKFEDIDNNIAEVSAVSDLASSKKNTMVMGEDVSADLKGKSRTVYYLNITSGMVSDEKVKSNLSGTIQIMGQEVPIDVNIDKNVVVKKI